MDNMTYMMLTEDFEMGLIKIMLLYLGIILYSFTMSPYRMQFL